MQRIVAVFLLLLRLGWLASQLPATPEMRQPRTLSWRRTSDGWEHADWLNGGMSRQRPALHPVMVALLLLLFALFALVGFSPETRQDEWDPTRPASDTSASLCHADRGR